MRNDYKDVFLKIEESLRRYSKLSNAEFDEVMMQFKEKTFRPRLDNEYFEILRDIVFYSGFKATTVDSKKQTIIKNLPDYRQVAAYGEEEKQRILSDTSMIKNRDKVEAIINNAKTIRDIVDHHGSFQNYLDGFNPEDSFENLMLLKEELQYRFDYIGNITVYHFLTDIGLNVLKPDRVVTRVFQRLGFIEDGKQLLKTVIQGRKFAAATDYSIRYIDIVFVKYGQSGKTADFKLDDGICLEKNPKCYLCVVNDLCKYPHKQV